MSDPGAKQAIRAEALALGFDAVGFAPAELSRDAAANLRLYLAEGYHGDMGWLADTAARRADPRVLWPEARSVVVVGLNYGPAEDPLALLERRDRGSISVYARNRDYHDVLKKRLKRLARLLKLFPQVIQSALCSVGAQSCLQSNPLGRKGFFPNHAHQIA